MARIILRGKIHFYFTQFVYQGSSKESTDLLKHSVCLFFCFRHFLFHLVMLLKIKVCCVLTSFFVILIFASYFKFLYFYINQAFKVNIKNIYILLYYHFCTQILFYLNNTHYCIAISTVNKLIFLSKSIRKTLRIFQNKLVSPEEAYIMFTFFRFLQYLSVFLFYIFILLISMDFL